MWKLLNIRWPRAAAALLRMSCKLAHNTISTHTNTEESFTAVQSTQTPSCWNRISFLRSTISECVCVCVLAIWARGQRGRGEDGDVRGLWRTWRVGGLLGNESLEPQSQALQPQHLLQHPSREVPSLESRPTDGEAEWAHHTLYSVHGHGLQ